jgi:hypothetical protein
MPKRASLFVLVTLLLPATASAGIMAPPPGLAHRLAAADLVIVGTVEGVEDNPVHAAPYPGAKEKAEFQIAVVKVVDPILNAKGLTHVRVGFLPTASGLRGRVPPVRLEKGKEVCLFLHAHPDANFHVVPMYYDVLDKATDGNYAKEVAEVKRLAGLLNDPKAGLKAKAAADRYATAGMLVLQYRREKPGAKPAREEAVDAELSKLILEALAEADWKNAEPVMFGLYPATLFWMLGVTEKDGWTPPMIEVGSPKQIDVEKLPGAAKKWCKDNADKYRVKRLVYDQKQDK